jgi:hypothetical protein
LTKVHDLCTLAGVTTGIYAPPIPKRVKRAAVLAVARKLGHEAVHVHQIAEDRLDRALVCEVTSKRWPSGCLKLGRCFIVTVSDDGRSVVREQR